MCCGISSIVKFQYCLVKEENNLQKGVQRNVPAMNPCTNQPCKNGGSCTVTADESYTCHCAEGFYGDSCEKGT